jgi:hypothetical protein
VEDELVFDAPAESSTLVLACGAVAREVLAILELNGWSHVDVRCLPASLHSTPREISGAVDAKLHELGPRYENVFVAYADCGTAGALDRVLAEHGVERLPGAHCYAFFAGIEQWQAMHDAEPGTYYLTDFLARHFQALVVRPLGIDRHPELIDEIFRNYRKLIYLAQSDDPSLERNARAGAELLGLQYERHWTGFGELQPALERIATR